MNFFFPRPADKMFYIFNTFRFIIPNTFGCLNRLIEQWKRVNMKYLEKYSIIEPYKKTNKKHSKCTLPIAVQELLITRLALTIR